EVESALSRPEKARGIEGLRAELIGRDDEFTKLQEALAELLRGRGQMVSLIGEAGVGKSRLVSELRLAALAGVGGWGMGVGEGSASAETVPSLRRMPPPTPNPQPPTPIL